MTVPQILYQGGLLPGVAHLGLRLVQIPCFMSGDGLRSPFQSNVKEELDQ